MPQFGARLTDDSRHILLFSYFIVQAIVVDGGRTQNVEITAYIGNQMCGCLIVTVFISFLRLMYIGDVFKAKIMTIVTCDSHYCICLGHLGWCDRDRIISIFCCATQGGQGKYSNVLP